MVVDEAGLFRPGCTVLDYIRSELFRGLTLIKKKKEVAFCLNSCNPKDVNKLDRYFFYIRDNNPIFYALVSLAGFSLHLSAECSVLQGHHRELP